MDVPLNQVVSVIMFVAALSQLGVAFSGTMYVLLSFYQKIAVPRGYEPIDPNIFEQSFERFFMSIFGPMGAKISTLDRSPKVTVTLLQVTLGGVALTLAIVFQITTMYASTGIAIAGYHFAGWKTDLTTVYQLLVASSVLFTLVFMTYGHLRIRQSVAYS